MDQLNPLLRAWARPRPLTIQAVVVVENACMDGANGVNETNEGAQAWDAMNEMNEGIQAEAAANKTTEEVENQDPNTGRHCKTSARRPKESKY